jgi:hypothetical protein
MATSPPAPIKHHPGRPAVPYICRFCLNEFPAREIRNHQPHCPSSPAIIRQAKQAELEAYMAPIEQQATERLAAVAAKAVR